MGIQLMKIWSLFFIKGEQILIKVALAIFYYFHQELKEIQDGIEILEFLQGLSHRIISKGFREIQFFQYVLGCKEVNNRLLKRLIYMIDVGINEELMLKKGNQGQVDWVIITNNQNKNSLLNINTAIGNEQTAYEMQTPSKRKSQLKESLSFHEIRDKTTKISTPLNKIPIIKISQSPKKFKFDDLIKHNSKDNFDFDDMSNLDQCPPADEYTQGICNIQTTYRRPFEYYMNQQYFYDKQSYVQSQSILDNQTQEHSDNSEQDSENKENLIEEYYKNDKIHIKQSIFKFNQFSNNNGHMNKFSQLKSQKVDLHFSDMDKFSDSDDIDQEINKQTSIYEPPRVSFRVFGKSMRSSCKQ